MDRVCDNRGVYVGTSLILYKIYNRAIIRDDDLILEMYE